ncbi:neutrophilic granule protein-like [Onychomys torridus]|uniref:neutrophilic granule protein-like n=1 Tax=Onychomys torridus TaxID=38674 RepID=UPI00167F91C6|nr:neutrophilic granule protein-like [Onychomys torridus]
MARLWKALVLVVALALAACEAQPPPTYEDVVEQAIEAFNKGRPGKALFRLIDVTVPSGQNPTSNFPLKFRIRETDCISVPERQPQNCNFLENGEDRNCTGQFIRRRLSTSLTLSCDRDCSREGAQVKGFPDYPVADASEEDQPKDLPPKIRNIYDNAKYDIINNILRNF